MSFSGFHLLPPPISFLVFPFFLSHSSSFIYFAIYFLYVIQSQQCTSSVLPFYFVFFHIQSLPIDSSFHLFLFHSMCFLSIPTFSAFNCFYYNSSFYIIRWTEAHSYVQPLKEPHILHATDHLFHLFRSICISKMLFKSQRS